MCAVAAMAGLAAVLPTPIATIVSASITVVVAGCSNVMQVADGRTSSSVHGCGWEARSFNDKKLIGVKRWMDAANAITAEVTS
jgi:hypothetical protein